MESGKCTALIMIALLCNTETKATIRFKQQFGFTEITWQKHELLKKTLIELLAMENLRYEIEAEEIVSA